VCTEKDAPPRQRLELARNVLLSNLYLPLIYYSLTLEVGSF